MTALDMNPHSKLFIALADPIAAIWPSDGQAPSTPAQIFSGDFKSYSQMNKRARAAQIRKLCRFAGGDYPCNWRIQKAAEFIQLAQQANWMAYTRHAGSVWGKKKTKWSAGGAKDTSGDVWLSLFKDYEGDVCIQYPYRTGASPRGVVTFAGKAMSAGRAMCLMTNGRPPADKPMALHSCGNGHLGCVNAKHLYWGDASDNAKDARRHMKEGKLEVPVFQRAA